MGLNALQSTNSLRPSIINLGVENGNFAMARIWVGVRRDCFGATIASIPAIKEEDEQGEHQKTAEWGNDLWNIRFPGKTPADGIFNRPFGDKYFYTLAEAVEAPEYVVPWEAFCALAKEYNLLLQYCKPFDEVWTEEKDDEIVAPLSVEMGIRDKSQGPIRVSNQEMDAAKFYVAFCFRKV
ncbi:hypothetical protein BDZ45DRAFT_742839 [Acephala macrosclerotiorum]|nr:hypothetical protein BDZ45DRAFT_742839 [Acephala macrosclerotiorum]